MIFGLTLLVLSVLNIAIFILVDWIIVFYLFFSFSLLILLFLGVFFRTPTRIIEKNNEHVLAPADGKVVVIERVEEKEYFNEPRTQISIFMSPLDVHSNKNPISGTVKYVNYHKGKYLVAWHPKSSTENESNSVVIENQHISILVKQIAGAVARRIINYLNVEDEVEQGVDFGFIKFGSRLDVYLPLDSKIKVQLNQTVRSGVTVIATV